MNEARRAFVIIDPAQDEQIALERALITSEVNDPDSHIHLFIGVDLDNKEMKGRESPLYRTGSWLSGITYPMDEKGINYSFELSWTSNWLEAVLQSIKKFQPNHIFMPDLTEKKFLFSNHQWSLLRNSTAPVTIVRPGNLGTRKKILAAINMQKDDNEQYATLNSKILTEGKKIADHYQAEFHVINAYSDSLHYPDREKILKMTELPTQQVQVIQGNPADVISEYANSINADAVLIGTMARQGAAALMKGNTSEKVLSKLTQDVITYS